MKEKLSKVIVALIILLLGGATACLAGSPGGNLKGFEGAGACLGQSLRESGPRGARIPKDSKEFNGHSYRVYGDPLDWEKARDYCAGLGGHLVTVTSEEEQGFVSALIDEGSRNCYWLGAERDPDKSFSAWVTGERVRYTNFDSGEPNNSGGTESALVMYRIPNKRLPKSGAHAWNDLSKDGNCKKDPFFGVRNIGFICEWDPVQPPGPIREKDGQDSARLSRISVGKRLANLEVEPPSESGGRPVCGSGETIGIGPAGLPLADSADEASDAPEETIPISAPNHSFGKRFGVKVLQTKKVVCPSFPLGLNKVSLEAVPQVKRGCLLVMRE